MSGVNRRQTASSCRQASAYFALFPTTSIMCGQSLFASPTVMAVRTPKARASYEEVVTIVLSPAPVTAMALPFRSGLSRCSTEAKKASMSTHTMIFCMAHILQRGFHKSKKEMQRRREQGVKPCRYCPLDKG